MYASVIINSRGFDSFEKTKYIFIKMYLKCSHRLALTFIICTLEV